MSSQIETTLAEAVARNLSVTSILELLVDKELESRHGRAIEHRFKCSRLQSQPSIDAFHFHHHKSRVQAKNRILRLLDLHFLPQGTNMVLIGNPGVGKTFLARVFGWKACQANQRVLFTTAMDMLNHLLASQADHSLVRKLKTYTEPTLLIVDELGYLSLDQQTSNLFYQVVSTRHGQKRSTIITTNTPFSDWGNILFNTTIATAIADRLVENSNLPAGRRQFAQGQQELDSAGRVVRFFGIDQAPRCEITRTEESAGPTPQRRCQWAEGGCSRSPRRFPYVQLQRQSPVLALADGIPVVRGVLVAGPRYAARLPAP